MNSFPPLNFELYLIALSCQNAFMWNKIYTGILGISFLLMAGLVYYSYSWLQSVSAPPNVVQNYDYYANLSWMFLWISSLLLLVVANAVLWTTRNAWAMWTTFLYFGFFILIQKLWLDQLFFNFKQRNELTDSAISLGIFSGILLFVLAAAIVFSNQFIVKRMHDKMFAQTQPAIENQAELETDANENIT